MHFFHGHYPHMLRYTPSPYYYATPYGPGGFEGQPIGLQGYGGIPNFTLQQQTLNGQYMAGAGQPHQYGTPNTQSQLFQNPLQPEEDKGLSMPEYGMGPQPYPIPNQQPGIFPKPPPSQFGTILNSFKSQSGSLDINKMVDTAGQMMNALTQLSNMAKGIGGLFKGG
ncbi:YppG family protein [Siminovitchia sp. FSL H7-0308]|uniref:YppG family protein n=1 Tax=unclassified Siminovitchia TaxID=2837530 RepID=UPI0030CEAD18